MNEPTAFCKSCENPHSMWELLHQRHVCPTIPWEQQLFTIKKYGYIKDELCIYWGWGLLALFVMPAHVSLFTCFWKSSGMSVTWLNLNSDPLPPQSSQQRGGAIVMQLISIAMQQISVLVFTSLGPTWCSQHGDGQGAEGHRTSLGLVSHQAPWWYYSLCLFCARITLVCFTNQ